MVQNVLVLDFGGQYKELIARRVREMNIYSLIHRGDIAIDEIKKIKPIGIILTGGPQSVNNQDAMSCSKELFELGIPILAICYGMQIMCKQLGGEVVAGKAEFGKTNISLGKSEIFEGISENQQVLMSHNDKVSRLPQGFEGTAKTRNCAYAACQDSKRKLFGVQFHPETQNTVCGTDIIKNFLFGVCGAKADYKVSSFIENQINAIRQQVGKKRVLLALSGGVDSSVCAALLSKAIPNQLTCIFVDHGFMRKDEGDQIQAAFGNRDLQFVRVNAQDEFVGALKGVTDPEQKRKIVGKLFIEVFEREAKKCGAEFLAQGTIYPDIIESGKGSTANIKSHHNVGGLPEHMDFEGLVEPLNQLFKDEVRAVGRQLGLPPVIVDRQPFPGPGLSIRVIGEVTKEKLDILREADHIFREEVGKAKVSAQQYFAVLTNLRSVGVKGDRRTYDYTLALRCVHTTDFMTCEYVKLPHKLLEKVCRRIVNEVQHINRVVYDITDKPPATIEWE